MWKKGNVNLIAVILLLLKQASFNLFLYGAFNVSSILDQEISFHHLRFKAGLNAVVLTVSLNCR
jgi:hypothetical protein